LPAACLQGFNLMLKILLALLWPVANTEKINFHIFTAQKTTVRGNRVPTIMLFVLLLLCSMLNPARASDSDHYEPRLRTSTQQQALSYLNSLHRLPQSSHWHNVMPGKFLKNLYDNVNNPLGMYAGRGTNFCGYGALSYLIIHDDPLAYCKFLVELYNNGKATLGKVNFKPPPEIRTAAGALKYKGILDIRPAEQMFYLSLADQFKGYINIFNRHYDPGDEDEFWASVNYAKFNRMIRKLLHYKVTARGADIIRPRVGDLYTYISKHIGEGTTVLYINNRLLHKKNHVEFSLAIPTHFLVLERISRNAEAIVLTYWDYGGRTQVEVSEAFFKKITFGISICSKKTNE